MRELIGAAHLTPAEAVRKVYILHNVEMLTVDAANSLLKLLEEPPGHTVFILLADSPQILSTIISRCQVHRFGLDVAGQDIERDNDSRALAEQWLLMSFEQRWAGVLELAKGELDLKVFVDVLAWTVRDAYLHKLGLDKYLVSKDYQRLQAICARYEAMVLKGMWRVLMANRRLLESNVNKKALADHVFWVLLDEVS
jgi:hypothetical protein